MTVDDIEFGESEWGGSGRLYYQDVIIGGEVVAAFGSQDVGPLSPLQEWFQKCYPDTPENRDRGANWMEHWDEEGLIYVIYDTPEQLLEDLACG